MKLSWVISMFVAFFETPSITKYKRRVTILLTIDCLRLIYVLLWATCWPQRGYHLHITKCLISNTTHIIRAHNNMQHFIRQYTRYKESYYNLLIAIRFLGVISNNVKVPLCKFQVIIIIHFYKSWLFSQSVNTTILTLGANCQASYATGHP